uniref:C2 domain-containing protein n=1 Tax=Trichogramma kaykai TaxID=54128 RepID=A0ABD2XL80_9HYME
MDQQQQKSAKGRAAARGKLSRSRAVRSSSSSPSSSSSSLSSSSDKDDAAADDESKDFGSRIKLFRERRRSSSSARQKKTQKKVANDEKENRIETAVEQRQKQQQQLQDSIAKEREVATSAVPSTSIAQTIKKRFGFFRRSESVKSATAADNVDVEAGLTVKDQDKESLIDEEHDDSTRVLDVVADVHVENEKQQTKKQDRSVSSSTSTEIVAIESSSPPPPVEDNNIEEIGSIDDDDDGDNNEARPTSGRRKRWDKKKPAAEKIGAELLVLEEDSKSQSNKPRQRRQWAKGGAASAEIRNSSGQRILLPERSATAEPVVRPASSRLRSRPPIAAPRSRDPRKEEKGGGFDNEAFSSDHDEVLRIETIDDRSPTIKMSNGGSEYNDDESTTLSEEQEEEDKRLPSDRKSSIEKAEIQDFTAPTSSTNTTTTTESSEIQDSPRNNDKIASSSRRSSKSSLRRKFSGEKRSSGGRGDDDDFDEEDEEEDDQETTTVLTAMERGGSKSRRSSRSSSKKISTDNFFEKRRGRSNVTLCDITFVYPQSRRDSRHSRKSKSSSRRNGDDDKSSSRRSSKHRAKQPNTSSSTTRYSGDERQQEQQSQRPQKPPRKSRSKSKRRSRRKKSSDRSDAAAAAATNDEEEGEQLRYASIRIHRSDMLEADYLTRRPMVKVHLVYAETGEYPRSRGAKPSDEQQSLLPIVTDRFDFRAKRSMVPVWEQELVFEFNYRHLLAQGRAAVVLLFEIIDRVGAGGGGGDEDDGSFDRNDTLDPSWYKVAWAFLRPVGVNGAQHVDKRVRLQLYRPKKSFWRCSTITTRRINKNNNSKTPTRCDVYKWWKSSSSSRVKYPSSLYVTVCGVEPSTPRLLESVRMTTRDQHRDEQPLKIDDLTDLNNDEDDNNKTGCRPLIPDEESSRMTTTELGRPKWTRHAAQSCQIPNDLAWETGETSERGCFALAFSHDGKYLACACSEEYDYPILVYKVDDGKVSMRLAGHKNFVYSVNWSGDDRQLVTCSSDQTARIWDAAEKIIEPLQALPHPSYVYCGQFLGSDSGGGIVTGCYDHVARVWSRSARETTNYELIQELEGHESFVSAVCCDEAGDQLITGDGAGTLIVWLLQAKKTSTPTSSSSHRHRHRVRQEWQIAKKLKLKDLEGVAINTLLALGRSANGPRLIVHSRNDELRLLEATTGLVVRKFTAPAQLRRNRRIQARACASPCGGLLFCGGDEASRLCVWSLDTGRLLATYEPTSHPNQACTCVDYHPYDHALAYGCYGAPGQPVRVLRYDREADGSRVGLKLLQAQGLLPQARIKLEPVSRNGSATRSSTVPFRNGGNSLARFGRVDDSAEDDDESRSRSRQQQRLKGRVQNFMETGPSLRAKSLSRLSGIIEKIDRILMYATSHHHHHHHHHHNQQKSSSGTVMVDVEAARREDDPPDAAAKAFTVTQRNSSPVEIIELKDLPPLRPSKKPRKRSKSARNACSPTTPDNSAKSFFSDGNNRRRRYSGRGSDDSAADRQGQFVFETVDLDKIETDDNYDCEPEQQQEQQRKDSLDTIVDGKEEDFPSEEVLDVESLKSDDTYVVNKDDGDDDAATPAVNNSISNNNNNNEDGSDRSNATFVIESEIAAAAPVPKPRRRIGKIELVR